MRLMRRVPVGRRLVAPVVAVPVVVLTTSRRQEDVREMYAAGANTYIEKPQDFGRFVEVLQTGKDFTNAGESLIVMPWVTFRWMTAGVRQPAYP